MEEAALLGLLGLSSSSSSPPINATQEIQQGWKQNAGSPQQPPFHNAQLGAHYPS